MKGSYMSAFNSRNAQEEEEDPSRGREASIDMADLYGGGDDEEDDSLPKKAAEPTRRTSWFDGVREKVSNAAKHIGLKKEEAPTLRPAGTGASAGEAGSGDMGISEGDQEEATEEETKEMKDVSLIILFVALFAIYHSSHLFSSFVCLLILLTNLFFPN